MYAHPRGHQETASRLHKFGTGLWFTEGLEFNSWLNSKASKLWLHGDAGVGKTILMRVSRICLTFRSLQFDRSSIIQAISEQIKTSTLKNAMAFFYCDYQVSMAHKASVVLGSLATQLAIQSEESFARLEKFYKLFYSEQDGLWTTPATADDFCSLIRDMSTDFDQVSIVVDALDECGLVTDQSQLTELLASLTKDLDCNIRSVLSSRNNVPDVSCHLAEHKKISIAAANSDLRLYVAAEIEVRPRIRLLRMRDPNLTEEILYSLIDGADGMWRWVTCQIDYLSTCESPNAIRAALKSLPPNLSTTYERILDNVTRASPSTQNLVHRVLKWMICSVTPLSIKALLEAVSLNEGMTKMDPKEMPDEDGILRWCSSLVRKTSNGNGLELAHSTVKEFFETINISSRFAKYKVTPQDDNLELAKICLTYLGLDCFGDGDLSAERFRWRVENFPFFNYAALQWPLHADAHLNDERLKIMMQSLFNPSKTNHFMCWSQKWMLEATLLEDMEFVSSTTTLHWAAALGLNTVCEWLLGEPSQKLDIDKMSGIGTPLFCALRGNDVFSPVYRKHSQPDWPVGTKPFKNTQRLTVKALLDAGASMNDINVHPRYSLTPLGLALTLDFGWDILLAAGARLDESALQRAEELLSNQPSYIGHFFAAVTEKNVTNATKPRYLRLGVQLEQTRQLAMDTMIKSEGESAVQNSIDKSSVLRKAALSGQLSVVSALLAQPGIDVDFRDRSMKNETPLHGACGKGHFEIVKVLLEHGADISILCAYGWNAYHYAFINPNLNIIQYLEEQGIDTNAVTKDGETALHLAAKSHNLSVLQHLLQGPNKNQKLAVPNREGMTPLLLAAHFGSVETIRYLLSEASPEVISLKSNGNVSLFHIIAATADPLKMEMLRGFDFDILERCDADRTVLHYLVSGITRHSQAPSRTECLNKLFLMEEEFYTSSPFQRFNGRWKAPRTTYQDADGSWSSVSYGFTLAACPAGNGTTALRTVCLEKPFTQSSLEAVQVLSLRVDVNADILGTTPLIQLACRLASNPYNEYIEKAIMFLLRIGADVNSVNNIGWTASHYLVLNLSLSVRRVLLLFLKGTDNNGSHWKPAKFDIEDQDGKTPLQLFIEFVPRDSNTFPLLDRLATEMVNSVPYAFLHAPLRDGSRLLNLGISVENEQIIQTLLDRGVSLEERDSTPLSRSALELLCIHGTNSSSLLELFVSTFKKLGTLNLKDTNGLTPLHLACDNGHENIVKQLVEAGAAVESKSDAGLSPIHYAVSSGNPGVVKILLEHKVSIITSGKAWNFSVLNRVENVEICRLLTDRGVDWNSTVSTIFYTESWIPGFSAAGQKVNKDSKEDSDDDSDDSDSDNSGDSDSNDEAGDKAKKLWESKSIKSVYPAHIAIWRNRIDVFNFLMANVSGMDMNIPAENGLTPLHLAVISKKPRITMLLLSRKADPNVVYSVTKWTPLHFAALGGSADIVRELLSHGANARALDFENRTPSLVAWEYSHKDLSEILKENENGSDYTTTIQASVVNGQELQTATVISDALVSAIKKGDAEWCKKLVEYGCNVNGTWPCSCSSLIMACRLGQWKVAKYFASIMQSVCGKTCDDEESVSRYEAIHYAACAGQHKLMQQLLEKYPVPPKVVEELFRLAAENGNTESLRMLHESYPDITVKECNRNCCVDWIGYVSITNYDKDNKSWKDHSCAQSTCLHCAVRLQLYDAVRFLLEIGANIEAREDDGETPLMIAMQIGDLKMMEILLHSGANANTRNDFDCSVLLDIARYGTPAMLQLLVKYGANLWTRDNGGQGALHYALLRDDMIMAEALIALGLNPLYQADSGDTPLHFGLANYEIDEENLLQYLPPLDTNQFSFLGSLLNIACLYQREIFVAELFERAPQSAMANYVNMASSSGTPLYAVASTGNTPLTELLLEHGAQIDLIGGSMGTPLLVACEFGRVETVKLLLRKGAKVRYEGADGLPIDAIDAARSHIDIQTILQRFVERGTESLDEPLPVHLADKKKLNEIFQIIEERERKGGEEEEEKEEEKEQVKIEEEILDELQDRDEEFCRPVVETFLPPPKPGDSGTFFFTSLRNSRPPQNFVEWV